MDMEDTVIAVSNLSKCFIINHEHEEDNISTLRELLSNLGKQIVTKGRRVARKGQAATTEQFWAIQDLSFTIERGSRVGIIGRNGAGKSTLLKILSRITGPTSGSLDIKGKVVSLLEVGTGFHPELTGRENIFLNGVILGMKRAEIRRKFDDIVAFAEIEHFLDTPVKKYSSGMYMRLAFAIAVHIEPDILILDEMLAVGDAQFQKKCLVKMDEISRTDRRTVLFVSHSIEAITAFCNRGIFLEKGRIVSQGPIEDVVKDYMLSLHEDDTFRPHTDHDIYFNTLEFANPEVGFRGELLLKAELIAKNDHDRFVIGLNFSDIADTKIAGNILFINEALRKGSNRIALKIPLHQIVPGNYSLNIAVALDKQLDNIDVVFRYPEFTILSDGMQTNDEVFAMWSHNWGGHILDGIDVEIS